MNAESTADDGRSAEEALSELQGDIHQLRKKLRATELELAVSREKMAEYLGHLTSINQSPWWRMGMFLNQLPARTKKLFTGVEPSLGARDQNAEKVIALPISPGGAAPRFASRVGVFVHAFNIELLPEIIKQLSNLDDFCLYLSTDTEQKKKFIELYLRELGVENFLVRKSENRGRDVAGKFYTFADVYSRHDFVLHLHTKKSSHTGVLSEWGAFLLRNLIGSRDIVGSIALIFDQCPEVGVIAPPTFPYARTGMGWGPNFARCQKIAERMGIRIVPETQIDFPAGSMFWARTKALQPLLDLKLDARSFDEEKGQIDGTLAHAIERLVFFSAEREGFVWIHAGQPESILESYNFFTFSSNAEIQEAIHNVTRHLVR